MPSAETSAALVIAEASDEVTSSSTTSRDRIGSVGEGFASGIWRAEKMALLSSNATLASSTMVASDWHYTNTYNDENETRTFHFLTIASSSIHASSKPLLYLLEVPDISILAPSELCERVKPHSRTITFIKAVGL
jgi:hypothetical protein